MMRRDPDAHLISGIPTDIMLVIPDHPLRSVAVLLLHSPHEEPILRQFTKISIAVLHLHQCCR